MASTSSVSSSATHPVFQASGLASGLDTNSIVDAMVAVAQQPLTALQKSQSDLNTQISSLGDLISKLNALQSAAQGLSDNGVLGVKPSSVNTGFTATAGSSAVAGSYSVQVMALAQAAKVRSEGYASTDTVTGGTLSLSVQGTSYPITIADGAHLGDVATAINQSGAPVSAVVLNDGTNNYLSITSANTGYPTTGKPADALSYTMTATGTAGKALALTTIQAAQNASMQVDGLTFTRQSNLVSDVLPGTTLSLQSVDTAAENLVLANDPASTQANLQKFATAYNAIVSALGQQLNPVSNRSATLADDNSIGWIQAQMQQLTTAVVPGIANVHTLAEVGLKTSQDGTLSVDQATLTKAIAKNPSAVNSLFSTSGTGISALVTNLANLYAQGTTGILATDQTSLQDRVKLMGDQASALQAQIDTYRQTLLAQFSAMESTVSSLKTAGNYITALFTSSSSSSG